MARPERSEHSDNYIFLVGGWTETRGQRMARPERSEHPDNCLFLFWFQENLTVLAGRECGTGLVARTVTPYQHSACLFFDCDFCKKTVVGS